MVLLYNHPVPFGEHFMTDIALLIIFKALVFSNNATFEAIKEVL